MTTHTFTAHFHNGDTATRTSEAAYRFATRRDGVVRFHTSEAAARRRVAGHGEIVPVGDPPAAPAPAASGKFFCRACGASSDQAADLSVRAGHVGPIGVRVR